MTSLRAGVTKFTRMWRSKGARTALEGARAGLLSPYYARLDRRFDRRHGIDTDIGVALADLPIREKNDYDIEQRYEAVPVPTFRAMMEALPADLSDHTFIDFGSGKGRALLLATRYRFRRVIGVELVPELHATAVRNKQRFEQLTGIDVQIELINGNAADFDPPPSPTAFFFYNPFPPRVMSKVLQNIERSYRAAPRKCFIVYANPKCSSLFDATTFLHAVTRRRFGPMIGVIYETID